MTHILTSARFLFASTVHGEDNKRRQFVLNTLLIGSIALLLLVTIVELLYWIFYNNEYRGVPPSFLATICLVFGFLYFLSRRGFVRLASLLFIALYLFPTTYAIIIWSAYLPQPLLVYALLIVMSGILLGSHFTFILTTLLCMLILFITIFQNRQIISVNLDWMQIPLPSIGDAIIFCLTLGIITSVSWLSNREIERSLARAIASEKDLQKERDLLEQKVEERTRELKQAQLEKMFHMYRFVEFGRMASGFFHDLSHPLTTLSLNVDSLRDKFPSEEADRAQMGTVKMVEYIHAMRKQLQKHEIKSVFRLDEEITDVFHIVLSKARESHVELVCRMGHVKTYGNPLRFNQMVTNLLTNAVDSYEGVLRKENRKVIVTLGKRKKDIVLTVEDFGSGISRENRKKIFDPFYTTKAANAGTGLGLSICKTIAAGEFGGKIAIKSREGKGSTFTVTIPIESKGVTARRETPDTRPPFAKASGGKQET